MLDDTYFMKQALMEADKAFARGEVPVGAVVVCRERIIARAHNLTETLNDVTAHAEMQAITAAADVLGGKYLNECTLYVTVEPCVMWPVLLLGRRPVNWYLVLRMKNGDTVGMLRRLCILKQLWWMVSWSLNAPI